MKKTITHDQYTLHRVDTDRCVLITVILNCSRSELFPGEKVFCNGSYEHKLFGANFLFSKPVIIKILRFSIGRSRGKRCTLSCLPDFLKPGAHICLPVFIIRYFLKRISFAAPAVFDKADFYRQMEFKDPQQMWFDHWLRQDLASTVQLPYAERKQCLRLIKDFLLPVAGGALNLKYLHAELMKAVHHGAFDKRFVYEALKSILRVVLGPCSISH